MIAMRKRYRIFFTILLMAVMVLAAIPPVSAFTATLDSPADNSTILHSGDTINIAVTGLALNDQLTYRVTSTALNTPGNTITLSNVDMPFGFKLDGTTETHLKTTGVSAATLTVKRLSDSVELSASGTDFTRYWNIKKDKYDVSITGTKTGTDIGIDYSVKGTVQDPGTSPSTLSLTLSNINSGQISIEVLDGSTSRLLQSFTITVLPTPTPINPYTPGDDAGPGPAAAAAAAAPLAAPPAAPLSLLAPPGISPTTVTLQHNPEGQVLADYLVETDPAAGFSSSLSITTGTKVVSGTGQPVGELSITPVDPSVVPDMAADQGGVFSFSGLPVECEPSGTRFSGGSATISFALTPEQWADALGKVNGNTAAMTIQFYDTTTNSWASVPTTVDPVTHTVTAQVTHFSMYALIYKTPKEESSPTMGDLTQITPATPAPVTTPVNTMMAPPSTTEAPGLPGIVVIGVVVFVGFLVARKKQ
jgi:hypothetical protein